MALQASNELPQAARSWSVTMLAAALMAATFSADTPLGAAESAGSAPGVALMAGAAGAAGAALGVGGSASESEAAPQPHVIPKARQMLASSGPIVSGCTRVSLQIRESIIVLWLCPRRTREGPLS
jgi:hypothetical protein